MFKIISPKLIPALWALLLSSYVLNASPVEPANSRVLKDDYGRVVLDEDGLKINYLLRNDHSPSSFLPELQDGVKSILIDALPESTDLPLIAPEIQSMPDLAGSAGNKLSVSQLWRHGIFGTHIGARGMYCADIDNDGIVEVVLANQSRWYLLEYNPSSLAYEMVWLSEYTSSSINCLFIADPDDDGVYDIFVAFSGGKVRRYDGISLQETAVITAPQTSTIRQIAVADADNDAVLELVFCNDSKTFVYNLNTLALEQTINFGGKSFAVGNVDANPDLEIVFNNGKVIHSDGTTVTTKWSYAGGDFGDLKVELSDFDGDGMCEIVGLDSWDYVTAFDADLKSPKWQIDLGDLDTFLLHDVTGDGIDEILIGDGQWGDVRCFDANTRTQIWKIDNPEHGVTNIAVGDADGDGDLEIMWGAGASSSGADYLFVHDIPTLAREWVSKHLDGPFQAVDVGDVDDDGDLEIVAVSYNSESGYDEGVMLIFDAATYELEWQSSAINDADEARAVKIGDVDNDGDTEIIVASGAPYDGAINIFNGKTHALESSRRYDSGAPLVSLAIADVDNDGEMEIIAGGSYAHSGCPGRYVYVIDGASGVVEWHSVNLGGTVYSVEVADLGLDGVKDIIATNGTSLYVFNGITHTQWQTPGGYVVARACDIDDDGHPEILAGTTGGIVVCLDGQTKHEKWRYTAATGQIDSICVDLTGTPKIITTSAGTISVHALFDRGLLYKSATLDTQAGKHNSLRVYPGDADMMRMTTGTHYTIEGFEYDPTVACTVAFVAGDHGSLTGALAQTVNYAGNCTAVSALADEHYHFSHWSGDYTGGDNPLTLTGITANITVVANFAIDTYSVTYQAGEGGTISGHATQIINHGADGSPVTAVPNTGYHFTSWSDGLLTASRTETNVTADFSVIAEFAMNPSYLLTVVNGSGGGMVVAGMTASISADAPTTGHHFSHWTTEGGGAFANPAAAETNYTMPGHEATVTANYANNLYRLTYLAGSNGSITGPAVQTVPHGDDGATVTATPAPGHHFLQWSDGLTSATRTDNNVTANLTVNASFAINVYALRYLPGENGSISGDANQSVVHGGNGMAVAAIANPGYHFVIWSDGVTAIVRSDLNVAGDITVTAHFAENQSYQLSVVNGIGDGIYVEGSTVNLAAYTPPPGKRFLNWTTESAGIFADEKSPVTLYVMPGNDNAVTANYINFHLLSYYAGTGGSISGATTQTVDHGGDGTAVTAVPIAGHHFVAWSDGSTDHPRRDLAVTASINVTATFDINFYTLSYLAGDGGTIAGQTTQTVVHGGNASEVIASASPNHRFVQWSDGWPSAARTDLDVTGDISVTATFELDQHRVEFLTDGTDGASLTGNPVQTIIHGGDTTAVYANSPANHHFAGWTGDHVGAGNPLTITNVASDMTVTANFAINVYTVTFQTDGTVGAALSGALVQTVAHGANCAPVEAVPSLDGEFLGWSGGFLGNPLTITNVTSDLTVTAFFQVEQVTRGSVFDITAEEAGLEPHDMFTSTPQVYAEYHHPLNGHLLRAVAKVLTHVNVGNPQDLLHLEWIRLVRLHDPSALAKAQREGVGAAAWLDIEENQRDLLMTLYVSGKEIPDGGRMLQPLALAVPVIADIADGGQDAKGNDTLVITGTWFGTKRPKVWREYTVPGKDVGTEIVKRQAMKVVKPTEADADAGFKDSKGKPAFMNATTGASKAVVVVPAKAPKGVLSGTIVLENGVGLATGNAP